MAKRKSESAFEGRWNIVSMTGWDQEYLQVKGQPFIEFDPTGTGQFRFGYVHGEMVCRATKKDGKPAVEFTWEGFDEMEPESGYGWALNAGEALTGVLAFEHGDESRFTARWAAPKAKRTSGSPPAAADASKSKQ